MLKGILSMIKGSLRLVLKKSNSADSITKALKSLGKGKMQQGLQVIVGVFSTLIGIICLTIGSFLTSIFYKKKQKQKEKNSKENEKISEESQVTDRKEGNDDER